jgi:hypothetical protein
MSKQTLTMVLLAVSLVAGCDSLGGSKTLNDTVNPVVTLPPRSPTGDGLLGQVKECSEDNVTVNFRNLNKVPLMYEVNILNTFEVEYDSYPPYRFQTLLPPGDSERQFYIMGAENYFSDSPNPYIVCGLLNTLK